MKDSAFQFSRPFIQELSFAENKEFTQDNKQNNVVMRNNLALDITKYDNLRTAFVVLTLEVKAIEQQSPFWIQAKIASVFKWKQMRDAQSDKMLKINAPALLISYLRPIISQITAFSKFPPYDIPFLDFTDGVIEVQLKKE